ncbi:MAG TPA: hypothetical protein P5125_04940 [Kiritimatiellia bacterium]|jgi:hypothetical protein|nr:hypothetical protein [Kiritimatiellia bacterium]HOM58697.1 hypothetical protein [Kiritimatiellia bacterium]HPK38038.1 hypothetical protein [Kiritimatiellia bacterium]HPW76250.1 hypothetical protein [Kiritimatiellia bacterium]HRU19685.1 hypothetical protein [Kiritimatiellia bacterium]
MKKNLGMKKSGWQMFMASLVGAWCALAGEPYYQTAFETAEEIRGWKRDANWKIEEGAGTGGSRALVWTNDDPKNYNVNSFTIPGGRPGLYFVATFKVKPEKITGARLGCTICWTGKDKWLGGAGGTVMKLGDKRLKPDADGWYEMTIRMPSERLPEEATAVQLQLYVHAGGTGRVAFDDIRVDTFADPKKAAVKTLTTSCYRDMAATGIVHVRAGLELPDKYLGEKGLVTELAYRASDGARRQDAMRAVEAKQFVASIPVTSFAMGQHPLVATLKLENGEVLGEKTLVFERVDTLPPRRVCFDRYGRTLVEGKRFFPLGMYWSENTLAKSNSLERYASGPFNCLQTYEKQMTPEILDRYWRHGLRVVASVKDIYVRPVGGPLIGFTPPEVKTRTDETNYVKRVVERCRNHPALLAWYTCDEIPHEYADRVEDRYSLLKQLDPDHPTFICLNHPVTARVFIDCTDVVGSDPYPIPGSDRVNTVLPPDAGAVWRAGDSARTIRESVFGLRPMWQVPQAFAWKWDKSEQPELRFPTRRELSSMTWQQIAEGANGLLFYSYGQMMNKAGAELEENFRTTCSVAVEVRDLIPILLLEPGPDVRKMPPRTRVRTWKDGKKVYVLVCNTHPDRRVGQVEIEGAYTTCAPVFGSGVTRAGGVLSLDMDSMGTAVVRLEP